MTMATAIVEQWLLLFTLGLLKLNMELSVKKDKKEGRVRSGDVRC